MKALSPKCARVLALCGQAPQSSQDLVTAMDLPERGADNCLQALQAAGLICKIGKAKGTRWLTIGLHEQMFGQQSESSFPSRPTMTLPTPTVEIRDGVRVTVAPAPRGRYESDIHPGEGVISRDWERRRQMVKE